MDIRPHGKSVVAQGYSSRRGDHRDTRPAWRVDRSMLCSVAFGFMNASFSSGALAQNPLAAAAPASPAQPASNPDVVKQIEERLRNTEEMNRRLAERLERSSREHSDQLNRLLQKIGELSNRLEKSESAAKVDGAALPSAPPPQPILPAAPPVADTPGPIVPAPPWPITAGAMDVAGDGDDQDNPVPDYTEGQFAPFQPPPGYPPSNLTKTKRFPLNGSFGPGFEFKTPDDEYRLVIHYESQIEARLWNQTDQIPANSGIFLPRQRIFFSGNISRPIEYEFALNRGSGGTVNVLNAFINVHLDDRLQVRLGRFFTPLPYDQYAISNYWLPTPERSIFTTNLSLNRQFGLMAWGYLFDQRLDYAAGIFNGSRNSFESLNNGVDFVSYINARPFQNSDALPFAKFLNLGTSVAVGNQDQPAVPFAFRIAGGSPNSDIPGAGTTPFLVLNRDTLERGQRLLGSVHAAYFYKGLSLIGEWQYGYGGYANPANPTSVRVPFAGYYVTGGYFLTGEHVEQRSRVRPLRPFIPRKGERRGPGAWEAVARFSELRLGREIFTGGFADPDQWSNSAQTTEVGMNWYWNDYIKIYTFWLHGEFGEPVLYRPGRYQQTADMFWMRFQLYF